MGRGKWGEIMAEPTSSQRIGRSGVRVVSGGASVHRLRGVPPEQHRAGSVAKHERRGGAEINDLITEETSAPHHNKCGIEVQGSLHDRPTGGAGLEAEATIVGMGMIFQHGRGPFQDAIILKD